MSDSAQILVAIDCPAEEAVEHGEAVLQWLVEHGIVQPELSDCVLGGDGRGYAPGPEMSAAVDSDADGTRQLRTNGVAIVVGRTIVDGGENEIELRCRRCRTSFEPTDGWFEAMDSWPGARTRHATRAHLAGSRSPFGSGMGRGHGALDISALSSGTGHPSRAYSSIS